MSKYILPPSTLWTAQPSITPTEPIQQKHSGIVLPFTGNQAKSGKTLVDDLYQQIEGNKDSFMQLQKDTNSRIWKFKVKPDKKSKPSLLVYVDTKSKDKNAMAAISAWLGETVGNTFETILLEVKSIAKKCCYKKCSGCNEGNPDRKI